MRILKEYRLKERYKQKDMAEKLNINLNTYRNYELGKRTMPYNVLADFLILRNDEYDIELAKLLREME